MRASDDDRERVAAVLREAVGRGQLSLTEVDDRLRAAYAAVDRAELAAVTRDLPQAVPAAPLTRTAPQRVAARRPAEVRRWLGLSLLLVGIWALTSLAGGHALFFWPVFPIGFVGLSVLSGGNAFKGHRCGAIGPHRS